MLRGKALDYGITLSQHHLDLFYLYIKELIEWNRRINLTGLSESGRIIDELFLDSLIPAPFIPSKGRMLDVGSGAGFPGIVIKVYYPEIQTHLIEANSKKTSFLKQIIRLLKLNEIKVINDRIEKNNNNLYHEGYQIITSRAMAGLDKIIKWCAPSLSSDGILVLFLGSNYERDLDKNRTFLEAHSLVVKRLVTYSLPGKVSERAIAVIKKSLS